jgi:hypothetical protein
VDGFLGQFERWAQQKQVVGDAMLTALEGALEERAKEFAMNFQYDGYPTYPQLKAALLDTYGNTARMHYLQLK